MSDDYLIWSHEHKQWWRWNHAGYTDNVEEAGRYSRVDAISITLDHYPAGEEVAVNERMYLNSGDKSVWGKGE